LITLVIAMYCLLYHRNLFANKKFQFSLLAPFLLLAPWFYWNYRVYGIMSVLKHKEAQSVITKLIAYMPVMLPIAGILFLLFYALNKRNKRFPSEAKLTDKGAQQGSVKYLSVLAPAVFFILIVPEQFLHSLQFTFLPTHSWQQGIFFGEPPSFYFGRMLEFSPLYIFSFMTILLYHSSEKIETPFIRMCAMIILLFFIFWGNYQSRYILSSLPFFILLGAQWLENFYYTVSRKDNTFAYYGGRIMMWIVFAFIISKICYINGMISYPNDMCYF
jgi:hypothetical protein